MATPAPASGPVVFQYPKDTVAVGATVFDALALNAFIRRCWAAHNKGAVYVMGALPAPTVDSISEGMQFDCSGFCWWATFRKRLSTMVANQYWIQVAEPLAGAAVRYDAVPGTTYGHAGMIVRVHADGNYDTLESSSSAGGIKYRVRGGTGFWNKQPNCRFLVSADALFSINGVVNVGSKNLLLKNTLLAMVRKPKQTVVVGLVVTAVVLAALGTMARVYFTLPPLRAARGDFGQRLARR